VADSLNVLDLKRPIREADMQSLVGDVRTPNPKPVTGNAAWRAAMQKGGF
jgi:hypothetical protein